MRPVLVLLTTLLFGPAIVLAQAPQTPAAAQTSRASKRFPQPVRVGDLAGRQLLEPTESQPVLGRVEGVTRGADGTLGLVVRVGGVLGLGARPVVVPVDAVALLGEYVALIDLSPDQLRALPTAAGGARLGPEERIRVGLVRPFH